MEAEVIARWREHWEAMQADDVWMEKHRARDAKRTQVVPEIRKLVLQFTDGRLSLDEFRATFDKKIRTEWATFGLRRSSRGIFLNSLAKNLSGVVDLEHELAQALAAPEAEREAKGKIGAFMSFLERQIESGTVTRTALTPNHTPYLVSACWHMQQPTTWPIMNSSSCKLMQAYGLLSQPLRGGGGYLEFVRVFRSVSETIKISFWDLEHLCEWLLAGGEAKEGEDEDSERVWLISPGGNASQFDEFYREGIVAIDFEKVGDLSAYGDVEDVREAIIERRTSGRRPVHAGWACYQFAHEMEVGDFVFAKRGRKEIVGYGRITSAYRHEPERKRYTHVRSVEWITRGTWALSENTMVMKTLTNIGRDVALLAEIRVSLGIDEQVDEVEPALEGALAPPYTIDDACRDLFLSREQIEEALELLRYKKNFVLQGPPRCRQDLFCEATGLSSDR